jgi:hypothetical protein
MKFLNIKLLFLICFFTSSNWALSQKYMTKTGYAYFISKTDAIDIDANNRQVAAIANKENGEIVVIVPIKSFEFTLATADTHFNDTYMESDLYPKATFKGIVSKLKEIDLSVDGEYPAIAEGVLSIHGKSNDIKKEGKLIVKKGTISIQCNFDVLLTDYDIKVPNAVKNRVAEKVDIKLDLILTSM